MPQTVDGVEIVPGMEVWVWNTEKDVSEKHRVGVVYERKVLYYDLPFDPDDYIGARIDCLFADRKQLEALHEILRQANEVIDENAL